MEIKPRSWWIDDRSGKEVLVKKLIGESFKEVMVHYDVLLSSGERLSSEKCGYKEFLYYNSPKIPSTEDAYEEVFKNGYNKAEGYYKSMQEWLNKEQFEAGFKEGKESNKDDQNLNYRVGYNDGWHDCEASFELGNEFTDSIQEQAYDEGYDQAIDDLIEAGVIEEGEYSDEEYSEYEFGDVEDGEEEYCFSKELDKILNGAFVVDNKSDGVERKHSHYFKDVRHLDYIDVYQVCKLFPIEDDSGAITHATKKLLVAGGRGAGKDMIKDITEARDTLNRYLQIEGIE